MKITKGSQLKTQLTSIVVTIFLLGIPSIIFAQGGGGPIPPAALPLEGGIGALLVIGITYGVRRLSKNRKK